ncbi:DUF4352 domain-containing protein [Agathobacter sp.]
MKKKRMRVTAAVVILAFTMTGCGTKLYEMTDEEQQLIVNYSAYALSKYNVYQKDGMTSATEKDETEADKTDTEGDTEAKTDATEKSDTAGNTAGASDSESASVSLADAIGYGNLSVTYDGVTKSDTYKEGSYYSMEAGSGKNYAVMKFTVSNPTGADVDVDLFTNARTYTARFSDGKDYPAEGSFLTYSLTTYQGTIKAGESVDLVLLFKIPQDTACDDVSMWVFKDNVKSLIAL